jgi:hypothetical protein
VSGAISESGGTGLGTAGRGIGFFCSTDAGIVVLICSRLLSQPILKNRIRTLNGIGLKGNVKSEIFISLCFFFFLSIKRNQSGRCLTLQLYLKPNQVNILTIIQNLIQNH